MFLKGFDEDLTCRGFQFEIGKTYDTGATELKLCTDTVFHFCRKVEQVHNYYDLSYSRMCEIEVLGDMVEDDDKCGSNKIKIIREITGEERDELLLIKNGNTGLFNSGDMNSGSRNTGDWNTGDMNSGNRNTGDRNTGNRNTGDMNTGDWNTGDRNTGHMNSGSRNTGDMNSGDRNSGSRNTGDMNSGDRNSGSRNTGIFNSCNGSNGIFCKEETTVKIFDIESNMTLTEFRNSRYYKALMSAPFELNVWIDDDDGGHLAVYNYQEACANWWEELTDENKEIIKSIPNFNAKTFEEITGIAIKEEK